jgi:UDP-GlcNAc3NAcA epimerase
VTASDKIVSIVGARPQFIKAAMVSRRLRAVPGYQEVLVHTGQHYDANMSDVFFAELDLPKPEYQLGIREHRHGAMTGRMIEAVEAVLLRERPAAVVVYGDTNSTLAGALAAVKLHLPVAHVEAGLRSFNRRMPEETNRVLTDHCSDLLFAPTSRAAVNLEREGIPDHRVFVVGDVMYDAALHYRDRARRDSRILERLGLTSRCYVLATVHRAETTESPSRLRAVVGALATVAAHVPVVVPLHPRTRGSLEALGLAGAVRRRLRVIEPVGYLDMVRLEEAARLVVTDSGGVQKEAFFFRVPCVTVRDETEWTELVELGWNTVVPPDDTAVVAEGIQQALRRGGGTEGLPYGAGAAADAVARILASFLERRRGDAVSVSATSDEARAGHAAGRGADRAGRGASTQPTRGGLGGGEGAAEHPEVGAGAPRRQLESPRVSVLIPCRNEEAYIGRCLDSILANDFPYDALEILVADGASEDGTTAILVEYERRFPLLRRIPNPRRTTPSGLNLALSAALGDVIVVMGAHAVYPPNYIADLVRELDRSGADATGGVCLTQPGDETVTARAVAIGLSQRFGVGNAHFRVGVAEPRWVDTVPFGCYRRSVFDRFGHFDEELVRNQDDEFNLRLISRGGRIWLVPHVASQYFARKSLRQLGRMYYQYGYFKPLVARKVGAVLTVRQTIPPLFVGSLLAGGLLAPFSPVVARLFGALIGSYVLADLLVSARAARGQGWRCTAALSLVFPLLHVAYGTGFLRGMVDFWVRRRQPPRAAEVPMSR